MFHVGGRFLHWHRICRISGDYRIAVNDRGENVYVGLPARMLRQYKSRVDR